MGFTCGSLQCGQEKIFLSVPGFEHDPSAATLVFSSCVYERIHARFGILVASMINFQVFWDSRRADW